MTTRAHNRAVSAEQYGMAQAVLSGRSSAMPEKVARELVRRTPAADRSRFARELAARRKNAADEGLDAASQLSEAWHGRPPRTVRELEEILEIRTDFADLGGLEELTVHKDDQEYVIRFGADVRVAAVLNEDRSAAVQLYFIGGDQSIDLNEFGIETPHDSEYLGEVVTITYITNKHHIDGQESAWEHEFGEEGGDRPQLIYDTLNQKLELAGGSYSIALDDYDGAHSAGIRN